MDSATRPLAVPAHQHDLPAHHAGPRPDRLPVGRPFGLRPLRTALVLTLALLSLAAGTGGLVDLKFREVELPDVFRLIARLANRNILVGREVRGKFTMDLKQVEPLKAIDLVAAVNRFQVIEKNGILVVGSPETVDSVLGPAPVETIPLRYGDAAELAEKLMRLYKGKLDIVADLRTNSLLIRKLGK